MSRSVCVQYHFCDGVRVLLLEITDAFFIIQPFDMDRLAVFVPSKSAPEDIVESIQVSADLSQVTGEYLFYLLIETSHSEKTSAVDGELHSRLSDAPLEFTIGDPCFFIARN